MALKPDSLLRHAEHIMRNAHLPEVKPHADALTKDPITILGTAMKALNGVIIDTLNVARASLSAIISSATTAEGVVAELRVIKAKKDQVDNAAAIVTKQVADVKTAAENVNKSAAALRTEAATEADPAVKKDKEDRATDLEKAARDAEDEATTAGQDVNTAIAEAAASVKTAQTNARRKIKSDLGTAQARLDTAKTELNSEDSVLTAAKKRVVNTSTEAAKKVQAVTTAEGKVKGKIDEAKQAMTDVNELVLLANEIGLSTVSVSGVTVAVAGIKSEADRMQSIIGDANTNVAGAVQSAQAEQAQIVATEDLNKAQAELDLEYGLFKTAEQALRDAVDKTVGSLAQAQDKVRAITSAKATLDGKASDVLAKADILVGLIANAPVGVDTSTYTASQKISEAQTVQQEAADALQVANAALQAEQEKEQRALQDLSAAKTLALSKLDEAAKRLKALKDAADLLPPDSGAAGSPTPKKVANDAVKAAQREWDRLVDEVNNAGTVADIPDVDASLYGAGVFENAIALGYAAIAASDHASSPTPAPTTTPTPPTGAPGGSSSCKNKSTSLTNKFKDYAWDALHYYEVDIKAKLLKAAFTNQTITKAQWVAKGGEFEDFVLKTSGIITKQSKCQEKSEDNSEPEECCVNQYGDFDNGLQSVKDFVNVLLKPAPNFEGLNNAQSHSKFAYCKAVGELEGDKSCFQEVFTEACSTVGEVCNMQTAEFWLAVGKYVC